MLGTDVIGVRCRRSATATAGGLAWGAFVVGRRRPVRQGCPAPAAGDHRPRPPVAAAVVRPAPARCGRRERTPTASAPAWSRPWRPRRSGARRTACWTRRIRRRPPPSARARRPRRRDDGALLAAFRNEPTDETDLAFFDENIRRIRAQLAHLLPIAALIAITASSGWVGGEPVQVALMSSSHLEGAAAVAVFSSIGFVPLQGMTGLVSGVWNQHGYPTGSSAPAT